MQIRNILVILAIFSLLLTGAALAQQSGKGPGNGSEAYGRMYDAKTVETLKGEITAVDRIASPRPEMPGRMTLSLKTDKETVNIYLGPIWFIEKQKVALAAKDKVEVKGSRVTMGGKPLIIANYVKKGDQVLKLRDDRGMPLWRGQGMGMGR
ncbi:MAG: DNA-binding protein [Thermodesulfobacteriota bacterium]